VIHQHATHQVTVSSHDNCRAIGMARAYSREIAQATAATARGCIASSGTSSGAPLPTTRFNCRIAPFGTRYYQRKSNTTVRSLIGDSHPTMFTLFT
jgi:hypothetical protein